MANPNPHAARAARTRKAAERAGSTTDLQAVVWKALSSASRLIDDAGMDPATRLRAVHAVTQAAGVYIKLLEATEIDARLRAIEDARENEHTL